MRYFSRDLKIFCVICALLALAYPACLLVEAIR